jgi:uncharacterized protein (DUF1778 family)
MAQRQVNIRVDDEDFEILEASAFVNGTTLSDEVRQAVLALVLRAREEEDVLDALAIRYRRAGDAKADSTVTHLRPKGSGRA